MSDERVVIVEDDPYVLSTQLDSTVAVIDVEIQSVVAEAPLLSALLVEGPGETNVLTAESESILVEVEVQTHVLTQGQVGPRGLTGPPGMDGSGGAGAVNASKLYDGASPLVAGTPVYVDTVSGKAYKARANSLNTAKVFGFATAGADPNTYLTFRIFGALELELSEWEEVTGMIGGLVPGARYFLSEEEGMITHVAPQDDGEVVAFVGVALDAITLSIDIDVTVLL